MQQTCSPEPGLLVQVSHEKLLVIEASEIFEESMWDCLSDLRGKFRL
jgi:hypothetical protein